MTHNQGISTSTQTRFSSNDGERSRARVTALTVLLCVCASSHGADVTWPPPDYVQQQVAEAETLFERLRNAVPMPELDTMDWADTLDYDFDSAVSHVSHDIAYEPYVGVLRGPEGTAFVGSGNAWDQSLLLASLLKTMGASANVVTGSLNENEALRLLDQAFKTSQSDEDAEIDTAAVSKAFADYDPATAEYFERALSSAENGAGQSEMAQKSRQISDELVQLIQESGEVFSDLNDADFPQQSIAQDYAWVRWRLGPSDEWVDVHPAFGSAEPPSPEAIEVIEEEVPVDRQHRLSLQLLIERGVDNKTSEPELVPVMSAWEVPTANLFDQQIYLGMGPMSPDNRTETTVLVPSLNGNLPPGAQVVTVLGLTAPPDAAASPAGAIFSTVSSKGGKAAGALGALGSNDEGSNSVRKLLGVVLKTRIVTPQGEHEVIRRVADLRGKKDQDFPRSGMFQMIMDVDVGAGNPAIAYHRMLDYYDPYVRATYPMLAMARDALPVQDLLDSKTFKDLGTPKWPDYDLFSSGLVPVATEDQRTFRNGPLIATRRTNTRADGELLTVIDVLWNPSTVLKRNEVGQITLDKESAIVQGIRETLVESSLAGLHSEEGWSQRTPKSIISDAIALAENTNWSEGARQAAQQDLDNGYLLAITGDSEPHWWRIDPVTGQTLGMNRHGGSEAAAYVITLLGVGMSVYMFKQSVEQCDIEFAGNRDMADCCIVGNLMMTYTTSAVTAVGGGILSSISTKFASGIGAIYSTVAFTSADLGMGHAIGQAGSVGEQCRRSAGQF